jgi:hypothetical protein
VQVLELIKIRKGDNDPDMPFVIADGEGRLIFRFALEYKMNGKIWATDIWAYSFEDAEDRIAAMRRSLTICGQLYREVSTNSIPSTLLTDPEKNTR